VVGAVAGRTMTMAILPLVPWQQPVEGGQEVGVRTRSDLDDDEPGRRVRHEDRQQPIAGVDLTQERGTLAGQIRQATARTRPNREVAGLYGKMLRSASRSRPSPPRAGADS
jgi:hypothetical protein